MKIATRACRCEGTKKHQRNNFACPQIPNRQIAQLVFRFVTQLLYLSAGLHYIYFSFKIRYDK